MGFKENLTTNWIDKTIEYQGRKFYIIDQFWHDDREYLYGIDVDTINSEKPNVVFIYKITDDVFEHVESEKIFQELMLIVSGRMAGEMIKEDIKKYDLK